MPHHKPSTQPLLLVGFASIIALTTSLTGISLYYLVNYGSNITRFISTQSLKQEYAYTMRTAARERSHYLFAMVTSTDPFEQVKHHHAVREQGSIFIQARKNLEQLDLSTVEQQQLDEIIQSANKSLQNTYKTIDLIDTRQTTQARLHLMKKVVPEFSDLMEKLDKFIDAEHARHRAMALEATSKFRSTFEILMPLGLLTILLIVLIATFVWISISQSVSALSDYTDRLKLTQKREHLILQGLFDAVITTDENGYIQDFNNSAERMFGYAQKEVLGRKANMLMPDAYAKLHDTYMQNYTSTGETKIMGKGRALLGQRKDGSIFPIDVALTELGLDNKQIFIGTIRDITQQKEYEAALQKAQEELEQRVAQRTTELHEANEKLKKLANYDALTGLPNRFMFTERFKQALSMASRRDHKLAVLFMDLDGFKQINDSLGHEAGDALLQEIAERLRGSVRGEDIVARIGGDEFILVAGHINTTKDAAHIAQKIINIIKKPLTLKDELINIGISIGISCFPEDGTDIDTLINQADTAMYGAKQNGKNQYYYGDDTHESTA